MKLIALAGAARSGKSTFAQALVKTGFHEVAYGHVIKRYFAEYLAGEESIWELRNRMLAANPELSPEAWGTFLEEVLIPFELSDLECDAFTEFDPHKQVIRPILEKGGDLIYSWVSEEYFRQVDAALERGERVVNTRLVRIPEAREWVSRGGVIYVIERRDWPFASDWERDALATLKASGLVADTLYNHGSEADWQAEAEFFARDLASFARAHKESA